MPKITSGQVKQDKLEKTMETVAWRAGYYRENVAQFCEDYLGLKGYLKPFQKILLWAMNKYDSFYFLACRGLGKTFLVALFCVIRCILYPGTSVVVGSYTFKQSKETVSKITDDLMHRSPLLCNEVKKVSTGLNDCGIWFKNGSKIQCKVCAESSRGARCNILIIDESRMVSKKIIDTIMTPMLNAPRSPGYLRKPEYKHLQEVGKKLFLTSCWYTLSESFEMAKSYLTGFLRGGTNFILFDLPYQVSIENGILMRQTVENLMAESTFNDISFMMEYEAKFYGSGEDSLFNFKVLNDRRILQESLHNLDFYRETGTKVPQKQVGEKRILSVDVALLASKKHDNDASAIVIGSCIPTASNNYIFNQSYIETAEGLVTEELGLLIMRYYYQYDIDYIALDANGRLMPLLLVTIIETERNKARMLRC